MRVGSTYAATSGVASATEKERALEALSLIAKLFEVERDCRGLALPEHTTKRAAGARPVLELFDAWVERNRDAVDPGGPVAKAIGYYTTSARRCTASSTDGRLRLDNSISEQQLRNAVLGRRNWMFFANETGLAGTRRSARSSPRAVCTASTRTPTSSSCCGSRRTGPCRESSSSRPSTGRAPSRRSTTSSGVSSCPRGSARGRT